MTNDRDIIDQIEAVRSRNNRVWMNLVRLALEVAPERAKQLFAEISANDEKILKLSKELARREPA